ncbi:MAG: efflux RND transporter periplasmic adaptor subunit [Acidobacteriota bacterium]
MAGASLACSSTSDSQEITPKAPAVEALAARGGALPLVERLSGTVKARQQVAIRPEITAPVRQVLFESGAAVRRGDVLVKLDDRRLQDQLRQEEARLQLARAAAAEADAEVAAVKAEVTRSRQLAEAELISQLELETLEARLQAVEAAAAQRQAGVAQAQATVAERRSDLDRTVVRSPISGRLGQRTVEGGMLVDPSSTLFLVGDLGQLRVEVSLTESMLAYLREGQRVVIRQGDRLELEAALSRISPFLAETSFSTTGEIDLNLDAESAPSLRPGAFVTVDVLYGESEEVTLVPVSAAWEDPQTGILGVYVLEGGATGPPGLVEPSKAPIAGESVKGLPELSERAFEVELRPVVVQAEGRGVLGIEGIEVGEWVVVQGQQLLSSRGDQAEMARVRPSTWERVASLQSLQREDLLRRFLDKQRRYSAERGVRPPSNQDYLAPALRDSGAEAALPEAAVPADQSAGESS